MAAWNGRNPGGGLPRIADGERKEERSMAKKPEKEGMPVVRLDRQLKYQGAI